MEAFATLIVAPPTAVVLGLEMRPFSLGHYFILSHERSEFLCEGLPSWVELAPTAAICAHTWTENQRLRRSRFWRWITMRTWALTAGRFNPVAEILKLASHIRSAMEMPESKEPEHGRYLFSDWYSRVYAHLRGLGWSHVEAMDTPIALANRLFIAHQEEQGQIEYKVKRDDKYTRALARVLDAEEESTTTE